MDRIGKLAADSECRPAQESPTHDGRWRSAAIARVASVVLGCVVGFSLGWETNQTKTAAQTIASVRGDQIGDATSPNRGNATGVPDASPASDRDTDAIRLDLLATLEAVQELKAERERTGEGYRAPRLRQPQDRGTSVSGAADRGGLIRRVFPIRRGSVDGKIDAIHANLLATLAAVKQLRTEAIIPVRDPRPQGVDAGELVQPGTDGMAGVHDAETRDTVAGTVRVRGRLEDADVGVIHANLVSTLLKDRPIGSLTANVAYSPGTLPTDWARRKFDREAVVPLDAFATRSWPPAMYQWEAPGLCHGPLYFEEVNLERYGYAHSRDLLGRPFISGGRFVATIVALPYAITLRPPWECVYTLGHYRPGSCVPFQARLMELDLKAAAVQAAAVTGLIFAIP